MGISTELQTRCESKCELCGAQNEINAYTVPPKTSESVDDQIAVCSHCLDQIENPEKIVTNHWRCLIESMWSQVPAVQVMCYRMLERLNTEGWAVDAIGMMYMEEETMEWAQSTNEEIKIVHKDCNGNILQAGDTVTLTQDLNVKGANFTAKRGLAVRRIRLVPDNAEHIEGKVDGQQIVILTKFVKKA
jgi:protein PhnA